MSVSGVLEIVERDTGLSGLILDTEEFHFSFRVEPLEGSFFPFKSVFFRIFSTIHNLHDKQ